MDDAPISSNSPATPFTHPFRHGLRVTLAMALARIFLEKKIEIVVTAGAVLRGRHAEWIHAAGPGTVLVYSATRIADKRTRLFVVILHLEQKHGVFEVFIKWGDGVSRKKLLRGHSQFVFQSYDIVRRQEDVYIVATVVKTGNAGVAGKTKRTIFRHPRIIFEDLFLKLFNVLPQIAESDSTVLIEGATGTFLGTI